MTCLASHHVESALFYKRQVKSSEPENLVDQDIVLVKLGATVDKGMAIRKQK